MGRKRKQYEHLKLTSHQLFEIIRDHYQKNISQADIAKKFKVSASTISNIINDVKDDYVKYVIFDPREDLLDIENKIRTKFPNLEKIIIVPGRSDLGPAIEGELKEKDMADIIIKDVRMQVVIAAAEELQNKNLEGKILSLPQGPLVRDILRLMNPVRSKEAPKTIVTSSGFHSPVHHCLYDPAAIVTGPAQRVYPTVTDRIVIPCPAFLPNEIAKKIEAVPIVKQTIELANQANVLLTGFGTRDYENNRYTFEGTLEKKYWPAKPKDDEARPNFFVGDMAGCMFLTRNGNFIDLKTHKVMGIRHETIAEGNVEIIGIFRPRSIKPAGSKKWIWTYIAAAKWLNTLIVDALTAEMMIEEMEKFY